MTEKETDPGIPQESDSVPAQGTLISRRFPLLLVVIPAVVLLPAIAPLIIGKSIAVFDSATFGTAGQWLASLASLAVLYFLFIEKEDRDRQLVGLLEAQRQREEADSKRAQRSAALLSCPYAVRRSPSASVGAPEVYRHLVERVYFRNDRSAPLYDLRLELTSPPATTTWGSDGPAHHSQWDESWPVLLPGESVFLRVSERPVDRWSCIHFSANDDDETLMGRTTNFFGFAVLYTDELGNRWRRHGNNVMGWDEDLPTAI